MSVNGHLLALRGGGIAREAEAKGDCRLLRLFVRLGDSRILGVFAEEVPREFLL